MGSGSYWVVAYGCMDVKELQGDDALAERFDDLCIAHGIVRSFRGSYAGVALLTTLYRDDNQLPDTVIGIDDLPNAIRKAIAPDRLQKAQQAWAKFRDEAAKIGVQLPEGALIWLGDYD